MNTVDGVLTSSKERMICYLAWEKFRENVSLLTGTKSAALFIMLLWEKIREIVTQCGNYKNSLTHFW